MVALLTFADVRAAPPSAASFAATRKTIPSPTTKDDWMPQLFALPTVSTVNEIGPAVLPWIGGAMVTSYAVAVALALSVVSVGTNDAPKTTAPAAAGVHVHEAMNGVTVETATDALPAAVAPAKVNLTAPATLVVATNGRVVPGNVPLAPLNTMVGVLTAAEADVTPKVMTLPRAKDPMTSIDMI